MTIFNYKQLFNQKEINISLLKIWLSKKRVYNILKEHQVSFEPFIKNHALKIISYFVDVINEKQVEDCNRIQEFVDFLREYNISIVELFIICNGFKETIIEFFFSQDIKEIEIILEINVFFEENFSNILHSYNNSNKKIKKKLVKKNDIIDNYIIMSKLDLEGNIIDVSKAFCDISGYTKEELIDRSFREIKHPDVEESFIKNISDTLHSGKVWHGELKNLNKKKETYWVEATITPVFDEDGEIIYFDSIRQDITSKKELEEQQAILLEQSKFAAMGEMISMIAHQWRQPLQAVSILIQKLPLTKMKDGEISDELLDQVVEEVSSQLSYMSETIDDFRDFFLPDKPREKVSLEELIGKSVEFLLFMLKNDDIELKQNILKDIKVSVYINEVIQVFINIIKNARDILVEKQIENRMISIDSFVDEHFVIITIEDNAGGIPEDIIDKVFDPYFSTKDDKNGTGLGLYMSKTIIEKQSLGTLSVENSKIGAKFIIKLPIS